MSSSDFHYEGQDLEALADLPRYGRWIKEWFHPNLSRRSRVLEVGAGVGNFAAHYVDDVAEAVLVEPAPNLQQKLKTRFATRAHVTVLGNDLESAALSDRSFDVAVLVNVLEHVSDHEAMLRKLFELVRPGGALLLFVPALPWLYGSLDAIVRHVRRYTRSGLEVVVKDAGFEVTTVRYFDALGVFPWLLVGRVLRVRTFNAGAATLYDRVAVPLVAALERHVEPPIGKNLVCVARRPINAAPVMGDA